jgi:DNA polymerase III subunit delta
MYTNSRPQNPIANASTRVSADAGMLAAMATRGSPFGRVTLVSGPEALLADRAVEALNRQLLDEAPEAEVTETDASRLDRGKLTEITNPSLFATRRAAVVTDLASLPTELQPDITALATAPPPDLALVLVHGGGPKGKALLDKVKAAGATVVDCPPVKPWELPQFVSAEAKQLGTAIEPGAAQVLVDALGHDLRTLAAAVRQLAADSEGERLSADKVRRYFAGRSEVTSFAVADAALAGRTGLAMEQLRWALSTGVAPVLVTSALAAGVRGLGKLVTAGGGMREADLAREVGVPPWKLKSMRAQARGWDAGGLAHALQAVAVADAEVKGAADDAAFALERMVLTVSRARRG